MSQKKSPSIVFFTTAMLPSDDALLWAQLKGGDPAALEAIFRREAVALRGYGRKFTADSNLIADCLQDLFVELWRTRDNLGATDHIRKYLFVSFRRRLVRTLVKESQTRSILPEEDIPDRVAFSIENQWIETEESNEKSERLAQAIRQLSPRQQEILHLRFQAEMDYPQITEIMGLQYQSARNLLTRTLEGLRKVLGFLAAVLPGSGLVFLFGK